MKIQPGRHKTRSQPEVTMLGIPQELGVCDDHFICQLVQLPANIG